MIINWKIFQNFPQFDVDFRRNLEKNGNFWEKEEVINKKTARRP